jgi:predicted ATP-dependent endonuclease of OLD family
MIVLDREAPRTAYLLDADEAGKRLRKMLRGVGVASKMIFQIPDSQQRGLVVEDLIDTEVYARAVNEELHRSHGPAYTFPEDTLPAVGRPTAVQTWCNENRIKPPKKTAVAYRVLEEGIGQSILAEHYHKSIRQLFAGISIALQG